MTLIRYFFFKKITFGCAGSSLLRSLSLVAASRGYSDCAVEAAHCSGFSLPGTGCRARGLGGCSSRALEHRRKSWGLQAW